LRGFLVLTRLRTIPVPALAALAAALVPAAIALVFFYAPVAYDAEVHAPDFAQKIFYFHVPIALTAYACFGWGALKAFLHLWKRTPGADLESYVAIHQGVIFGVLTLVTGSIWAKIAWGQWWTWKSDQLVLFLVLFMFYSAYFMLRYSLTPGPGRANMSAVYALFGVVFIPVSWLAIHLSQDFIHPTVFTLKGPQMSGSIFFTFCVCLAAMLSLAAALYRIELAGKRLDERLRELRELLT
jgi:heme exporter protein C